MNHPSVAAIKAKLHQYRRKHYLNQALRGAVVLALLSTSLFVLGVGAEGLFWLGTGTRTLLFWGTAALALGVLGRWVAYPLTKYFQLTPTLTDADAARLIGRHFPNVDDKLLNLLQLSQTSGADNSLLYAAIEQRSEELRPVPFAAAINFAPNWRLARYLAIPALAVLILLVFNPQLLSDGAKRLLRYNEHFNPPPPFEIRIPNHAPELVDGANHTIRVQLAGNELPGELFLYVKRARDLEFQQFGLEKQNAAAYAFTFKGVHDDFEYYVGNERHGSGVFSTEVLARPAIGQFQIRLTFPAYTGRAAETLPPNVGDVNAPQGTHARWVFRLRGPVEQAVFMPAQGKPLPIGLADAEAGTREASLARTLMAPEQYSILLRSHRGVANADTVRYAIQVVPDRYPSVAIRQPAPESSMPNTGIIPLEADLADDYGFTRAELHFRFLRSNDPTKPSQTFRSLKLRLSSGGNLANLAQPVDFISLGAAQGDEIEYFLKVWDNDAVNGAKASTSSAHKISYNSLQDQYDELNQNTQEVSAELQRMARESQEMGRQFDKLQQSLLSRPNLGFEEQRHMQQMLQQHQTLQNRMQALSQQLQENIHNAQQNSLLSEETVQQLEQLRELMQRMANPELLRRMQEMQEHLRNNNSRNQMQRQMEDMRDMSERMQQDIQRTMELFRQLEAEQAAEELQNRIAEMQQRQEMLKNQLEQANTPQDVDRIEQRQNELRNEMNDIRQDIGNLQQLKQQTTTPQAPELQQLQQSAQEAQQNMQNAAQQMQNAEQQLQNAQQQRQNGQNSQSRQSQQGANQSRQGAQQQQQQAEDELQQMQDMLQQMRQNEAQEQAAENYEDLRNLLENLLTLSFDQEELRDKMRGLSPQDPQVRNHIRKQDKLRDDMRMIEDSLLALAKRVMEVGPFITDELEAINRSMTQTMRFLDDNQVGPANSTQHHVMTHLNNLANMLTESLQKLQQAMRQMSGQGGQQCRKPGSQGGNLQQLGQLQQMLNQQLQQMMKNGQTGQGQSERMQELARQQEAIRRQIQEMYQRLKQQGENDGGGLGNLGNIAGQMEDTEEDLRNARLNEELMRRQQQILSRMLDYDKAMREREFENRREGNTARPTENSPPADLAPEELRQRIRREQFGPLRQRYTPTYRNLVDEYFQILNQN